MWQKTNSTYYPDHSITCGGGRIMWRFFTRAWTEKTTVHKCFTCNLILLKQFCEERMKKLIQNANENIQIFQINGKKGEK